MTPQLVGGLLILLIYVFVFALAKVAGEADARAEAAAERRRTDRTYRTARAFSVARTADRQQSLRVGWVYQDSGVFDFSRRPIHLPYVRIGRRAHTREAS